MRRGISTALVCGGALIVACRKGDPNGGVGPPRTLITHDVGGAAVAIEAKLSCQHFAPGVMPNMDWRKAHDVCAITTSPVAKRGGSVLAVASDLGLQTEKSTTLGAARDAFDALTVESCADATRAVWRVHNTLNTTPDGWHVAYPMNAHTLHARLAGTPSDCASALAGAPSLDDWIAIGAKSWDPCAAMDAEGRGRDALRCALQTGLRPSSASQEVLGKKIYEGLKSGALEADLYAVLAPDPRQDARVWEGFMVRDALLWTPSREKKQSYVEGAIKQCAEAPCAEWRQFAIWYMVGELHDAKSCDEGLATSSAILAAGSTPDASVQALRITPQLCGCGASNPKLATVMRAALTRPSMPDATLPSDDFRVYEGFDDDCQDVRFEGAAPGGRCNPLCKSFPRLAGSWLARHCDAPAVAAAKAALAARPTRDPRTDMIVDGALRVLGRCDHTAFESELARVPPGAKPARVKELLEK